MQSLQLARRLYSSGSQSAAAKHFKVVVAGGGCGGCSVANRMANKLGQGQVCVVEPNDTHYYQPMWTLVGGGIKQFAQSGTRMVDLLPSKAEWLRTSVSRIDPESQAVTLANGDKVTYDYLVVALGVQLLYGRIEGALDALRNDPTVCSNYHPEFVLKTRPAFDLVQGGNAIFTFPNGPIKCPGAPQKIMYLLDDHLRERGIRDRVSVKYNTSLPVIFGVKKYAAALNKVCERKGIEVNYRHNLVNVDWKNKRATFEHLDSNEKREFDYSFLHIAPQVGPLDIMAGSPLSLDGSGWVSVKKTSLQHEKYPNVFALGDCSNVPTSKTAAAVASQASIVATNLSEVMAGRPAEKQIYDGYTSCPLVTSYKTVIMAEFDYNAQPLETFPLDQGKERRSMYLMKTQLLPQVYWHGLVKGRWTGPAPLRKMFDLFRRTSKSA
ncbi:hypothetical protein BOX15_Mlig023963g2 [Macrostomum lignano]|uniref:Uncharacterized protein n=2 Tax=Macrostomum lignano TaxID=282301 RepID=A0A267FI94_9PLAT|nr:hypothetical protein BOX15_Mlig023963g1 [Macrostomum lignano]PAA85064.1 hypothetical protein BOX15_Mlig023963g2 [Macrostomum lignano]